MPFMSINSASYPYLFLGDTQVTMPWHHGAIYNLKLASTYIRITQRGLQYSHSSSIRDMDKNVWESTPCSPTMYGLCEMSKDQGSMLWFPDGTVDIPDDFSLIPSNSYLQKFPNGSACTSANTNRAVVMGDTRYEVSLCDLLNSNLDIVYRNGDAVHGPTLYWRQDTTESWVYVIISILSIYLVSCVSENIVASIQNTAVRDFRKQKISILLTFGILIYLFFIQETFKRIVTVQDFDLMVHLFVYVLIQSITQFSGIVDEIHGSRISLLTACTALLTLRVHYSFDNPYILIFCVLFGTRSFFKLFALICQKTSKIEYVLQIHDMFTFCSMLENGLMQNSTNDFDGTLSQVCVVLISLLMAAQIFIYKI